MEKEGRLLSGGEKFQRVVIMMESIPGLYRAVIPTTAAPTAAEVPAVF